MKNSRWLLGLLFGGACAIAASGVYAQQKGGSDDFGPYEPVPNWFKPLREGYFERGLSVFFDSPNRIFFTSDVQFKPQRGVPAGQFAPGQTTEDHHFIMVLDSNGKVVEEWKQWENLIKIPHSIKISPYDPERNVWVVDRIGQQIFKFTHDGKKLLMTLGEAGVMGTDQKHFGQPANISFAPDGSFYIADGYVNTRIMKFDKNGKFLLEWGGSGQGPGQFKVLVHDVAVDPKGRVFVADRGNHRIQIFDANGKYIEEWPDITQPSYIHIAKDGTVWVVCGEGNRLAQYDMNGKLLTYWGMYGMGPGHLDRPHDMTVDQDGNLYVTIWSSQKVGLEKFVPRPGADRKRLIAAGFNR